MDVGHDLLELPAPLATALAEQLVCARGAAARMAEQRVHESHGARVSARGSSRMRRTAGAFSDVASWSQPAGF